MKKEQINIFRNGLNISIKPKKTSKAINAPFIELSVSSIPKDTKNIVEKKFLSDLTLPAISRLYGKLPKATPPINAPIAILKPR